MTRVTRSGLVLLVSCAGAPSSPPASVDLDDARGPRRAPHGCRDDATSPATADLPPVAPEGASGGGYESFRAPSDFVAVPLEKVDEAAEDGESPLYYFGVKRLAEHRSVWVRALDDDLVIASIEILRHGLSESERTVPFEPLVARRLAGLEPYWEPSDPLGHRTAYNWVLAWSAAPRDAVEWAWVEKGCERVEVYERFVRDGSVAWHARVRIEPRTDDATLARWLAAAFDAPLDLRAPPGRRNLAGSQTNR